MRNINSVNYLLEQKYLEYKRNTDRGVLVEQATKSNFGDDLQDKINKINYGQFNSCTSGLGRVGGARIRFDGNFYYFSDGKYTYKNNFDQYKKDFQDNPEAEMKYSGTYSCKETKDLTTNTTKSIIKRVEDTSGVSNTFPDYTTIDTRGPIERMGTPVTQDTSNTNTTTTSGGGYSQVGKGYVLSNTFTPQVVTTLRRSIGSQDTSLTLSQNDINLLYQKISAL
jgi:hypothetical protein